MTWNISTSLYIHLIHIDAHSYKRELPNTYFGLWLLQPMFIQELLIRQYFFGIPVPNNSTFVHHDRAQEEFPDQSHIMSGGQHHEWSLRL